jgi:hypothetical protein
MESDYQKLSSAVADLRDVFPWSEDTDLGEIVHSPLYCLEAMIRQLKKNAT